MTKAKMTRAKRKPPTLKRYDEVRKSFSALIDLCREASIDINTIDLRREADKAAAILWKD